MRLRLALFLPLATLLAPLAPAQTALFTVTRLGNLGGSTTIQPIALNDNGLIVGYGNSSAQTNVHAFAYNGSFADLGTLGGTQSRALGVNSAGTVVGWSHFSTGSTNYHAFAYAGGTMTDLGTLGGTLSQANDVNGSGTIVGTAGTGTTTHGFRYANGTMTDLGTLVGATGVSYANAINSSGLIAGRSNASPTSDHAVIWSGGTIQDLGALSGAGGQSEAQGINDLGWVVGNSTFGAGDLSKRHAFLYANGAITDLGSLGGNSWATDVNNAGQVVGWGITSQFTYEAYLLNPLTAPTPLSAIPEPATYATFAAALALGFTIWRRHTAAN